jgi:predicted ATP-grasp superfamily ATP-dependent carboligase
MTGRVLICGTSTRAVAESAARAGFQVTALDGFADLDQHPSVRALSIGRPTAAAMARAARSIDAAAVVYLSPFENHPHAIAMLANGREVWGNSPDTIRRVRDPFEILAVLDRHGVPAPRVCASDAAAPGRSWVHKALRSGGGKRHRRWRGERTSRTSYLQEWIDGVPGSIMFAAGDGACVPLGFSRQLIGDQNFGGRHFAYCGNILARLDDPQFDDGQAVFAAAVAAARTIAAEFRLVGMNGLDFVARGNVPYPVEVNPRWSASVEVAERAFGATFFRAHADACRLGELPSFDCAGALAQTAAFGKAIVYARHGGFVPDTAGWLADPMIRDVPRGGDVLRVGQPVCSIMATAATGEACYRVLVDRAQRVYTELHRGAGTAAGVGIVD